MADLLQDVRLALRRLRGAPGFTLFAVASLAMGIGVTTAIYSAVRTLVWMPLGIPHADSLVSVSNADRPISKPDFDDLAKSSTVFAALGAAMPLQTSIAGSDIPQILQGEAVSSGYFAMTGVRPRLGRVLGVTDDTAGARVAVISERLWQTVFHGEPSVVGRVIRLRGEPFEIVGVLAGDFHGLEPDVLLRGIWIPLTSAGGGPTTAFPGAVMTSLNRRTYPALHVWGRLNPGATIGQATADVALIARQLDVAYPPDGGGRSEPRRWIVRGDAAATPARDFVDTIALMIVTAIATLLLIACTNLANLALARGTARAQEIAVRSALGASRLRLVREQLVESAIVVVAGGALGVAVSIRLLSIWSGDLPVAPNMTILFQPQVDTDVLFASAAAMIVAVAVFGVWPALQSTRGDVRDALGTGGPSGAPPKWRLHRNIVAWQVCGSVALLLVALLCARILATIGGAITTTTRGNLALAQIDFGVNGQDESQMRQAVASMLDGFGTQAGVRSASASDGLPFGFGSVFADTAFYATPDHASAARTSGAWSLTPTIAITTEFFPTVGMRLARGRAFMVQDTAGAPLAAIVSEEFARETFRSTDVVGRTLVRQNGTAASATARGGAPPLEFLTIVGVSVDDEPWPSTGRARSLIFVPFAQRYQPYAPITLVVRARDAATGVSTLRTTIRRIDPDLAITSVGPGSVLLEGPFFLLRVISEIATALGLIALVLAMAGLFGVLSHLVAKRTREIGVRLAMGAERRDIFRLILRDGLHPVGKGLALGLGIGVAARIAVKTFVVTNVAAIDPWPLLLLPIPFVLAAAAACYFPAARASRVDPAVVLRDL